MNNEINEILYNIEKISKGQCYPDDVLDYYDCKILVNYITNLQERITKAIEYIKENCIDDEFYINLTNKEKNIINALKILQGE